MSERVANKAAFIFTSNCKKETRAQKSNLQPESLVEQKNH